MSKQAAGVLTFRIGGCSPTGQPLGTPYGPRAGGNKANVEKVHDRIQEEIYGIHWGQQLEYRTKLTLILGEGLFSYYLVMFFCFHSLENYQSRKSCQSRWFVKNQLFLKVSRFSKVSRVFKASNLAKICKYSKVSEVSKIFPSFQNFQRFQIFQSFQCIQSFESFRSFQIS